MEGAERRARLSRNSCLEFSAAVGQQSAENDLQSSVNLERTFIKLITCQDP